MIKSTKAPFEWDLNQPGSPGEIEPQQNIEASATNREVDKSEIVKESARSAINWTVKKRRTQIGPSENKSWNWKSFPESTTSSKLKKPRKKYIPTKEQQERYRKRKRESYASMDKAARKRLASKLHIQQKERFANMTPQEQKAFVARRNELERIRKRKLKITRTEEETLKHQTVRQIQNKRYRLNKQAKKGQ